MHSTARDAAPQAGVDDEAFHREGRTLLDRACTGDQRERGQTAVMTDELLNRSRHALEDGRLSPPSYARVLRAGALVRNLARLPELPPDPLVHDLVAHTVQHGLAAHNAAAQALRGSLAASHGAVDDALDAAVDAMVTVELLDEHSTERALAMSDTARLLDQLGLPEIAADLYGQAAAEFGAVGNLGYQVMMTGDQVSTLLTDGLWLERAGQPGAAADRFATAAALADSGMRLWRGSESPPELDDDFAGNYQAALALAAPAGAAAAHEEALRKVSHRIAVPGQIMAGLALVRLLSAGGRRAEADQELADLRAACQRFRLPMPVRLALARGVFPADAAPPVVAGYLAGLERELWVAREARTRALHARLERERLRRGREPLPAMTGKDPVSGLPDRGVLDDVLAGAAQAPPAAVAMVDVDDLVLVNERGSYADGDAVLRAVAVVVCAALRPEDSVVRFSADEFVVVMPGRTLDEAAAAMHPVVGAVTELPRHRGHGATVSVGVVAVEPDETAESVLVRVDDATSRAKARGGNQVAAVPSTPLPR